MSKSKIGFIRCLTGFSTAALLAGCGGSTEMSATKYETRDITETGIYAALLPPDAPAQEYLAFARKRCEGQAICKVMAWNAKDNMASALPMLDREVAAQVFAYSLNRNSSYEQALWRCPQFKVPRNQCFAD